MAIILNIDTALDTAYISLSENGKPILSAFNESQKDHAAWIQPAINKLMHEAGFNLQQLQAVGVNIGPGSYTGLRIGLATAKGICFALNLPLIIENSLKITACSAISYLKDYEPEFSILEFLFCPMIDARRMEVFTAIYDFNLQEVMELKTMILTDSSFKEQLKRQKILFLGNGSIKFQHVCQDVNALFKKIPLSPLSLTSLTYKKFIGNNFAELANTGPLYLKEFFTNDKKA